MYELKQTEILAYQYVTDRLKLEGYEPIVGSIEMWNHTTRKTTLFLCVADFGVRYFSKEDDMHILDTLGKDYNYAVD